MGDGGLPVKEITEYKPEGRIWIYPEGFVYPLGLDFKYVRSTIGYGYKLEQAFYEAEASKENPFIVYSLATTDAKTWWEHGRQKCKAWGKVKLKIMTSVNIQGERWIYHDSLKECEFWELINVE
jgi:hypothetical protein